MIVTAVRLIRSLLRQFLMIFLTLIAISSYNSPTARKISDLSNQGNRSRSWSVFYSCKVKNTKCAVLWCTNSFLSHQVICVNANNVAIDKLACDWSVLCSPWAFLEVLWLSNKTLHWKSLQRGSSASNHRKPVLWRHYPVLYLWLFWFTKFAQRRTRSPRKVSGNSPFSGDFKHSTLLCMLMFSYSCPVFPWYRSRARH